MMIVCCYLLVTFIQTAYTTWDKDYRYEEIPPIKEFPEYSSREFYHRTSSDNSPNMNNYYEFLINLGLHNLCSLLRSAQIDDFLLSQDSFTLFGPIDSAFDFLPDDLFQEIRNSKEKLQQFLLAHMANGHLAINDIENDQMIVNMNETFLRFNSYHGGEIKTVSGAQVIKTDSNGPMLVYVIDRTLGLVPDQNIVDYLNRYHQKFYQLLQITNITQNIAEGTYTIFAPSDESFSGLPNSALNLLNHNQTLLKDVLLNHIVESTVYTPALIEGSLLTTVAGNALSISTRRGITLVNGISIVKPDIKVNNGVIHVINRLILPREFLELCRCMPLNPDPTISGKQKEISTTSGRDRHSIIVISPRGSNLPRSPVIVIKPSNFRSSKYGSRIGSTADFLYISPTSIPVKSSNRSSKTVLQVLETPVMIAGQRPAKFTIITSLLRKAGFIDILTNTNPLTTLLPTDEAFEKLPDDKFQQLQNDMQLLKKILLYHMVARNTPLSELQNNFRLPTYNGVPVVVNVVKRKKLILISGAEVLATSPVINGFVFIINKIFYPPPARNILIDLKSRPEVSRFLDLVQQANLETLFNGARVATVFVPTNKAFQNIPEEILKEIFKDRYSLQELIFRHVIQGIHYSKEFDSDTTLVSRLGEPLNFIKAPDGIYVNGVRIIHPDISSGNGVIHLIESVLSKEEEEYFTQKIIYDTYATDVTNESETEFTTLSSTISETIGDITTISTTTTDITTTSTSTIDITTTSTSKTDITAASTSRTDTTASSTSKTKITDTLSPFESHTNEAEVTTISLLNNTDLTEDYSSPISITTISSTITPLKENNSELLSENLEEIAVTTTDMTTTTLPSILDATMGQGIDIFLGLLNQSGYLNTLQDGKEYTIFVPTDNAVNSLPPTLRSTLEKQPKKLKKTLKHHIIPSLIDIDQIPNDETVPTLLPNKNVRINKYEDTITASGAKVIKPPIRIGNVQIMPIDQVLVPPAGDMHRTVTKSPLMKQFSKLIEISGLEDEIKQGGPFTLFAPSKKAFKKMSSEDYNQLITNPSLAKEFVLRHLVRGTHYTNGIKDESSLISEGGKELKLMNRPDCLGVNGVNFMFSDINTTNGVIHVIDDVL